MFQCKLICSFFGLPIGEGSAVFKGLSQPTEGTPAQGRSRGRTRWWIAWTLVFSTVTINSSRQSFSVLSPMIARQYHFTHMDIARILGSFQVSYAITWLLGGI